MSRGARALLVLAAASAAAACSVSTEREVYLRMPVSRLELPEAPARRMSSGPGLAGFERVQLTADQTTTTPDPQAPQFDKDDDQLQVRLDGALSEWVVVSGKLYSESLGMAQVKVLPLAGWSARGPFSLALTLGYGESVAEESEEFVYNANSDLNSRTTLRSSLSDTALVLGWRLNEQLLIFGGPYQSRLRYDGHYFSARGPDPDVEQDFGGSVTQRGANLGVALNFASWGLGLLEYASSELEGGRSEGDTSRFSAALQFTFGAPLRPPPPDAEPPVEVVPAGEAADSGAEAR